ncbi:hypothetical protein EGW08_013466 [Elysia chlorotica]|uniref:Uncharacterized protein n=1 Tax=Elysia chlorotica TaxID=188477 RepID=A0A3S1BE97_ELYCH|nr:hypothetical protein EGW08_013466 [Elysia chlorotica]
MALRSVSGVPSGVASSWDPGLSSDSVSWARCSSNRSRSVVSISCLRAALSATYWFFSVTISWIFALKDIRAAGSNVVPPPKAGFSQGFPAAPWAMSSLALRNAFLLSFSFVIADSNWSLSFSLMSSKIPPWSWILCASDPSPTGGLCTRPHGVAWASWPENLSDAKRSHICLFSMLF